MRTFLRGFGLGCCVSLAALMVATPALADDTDAPPAITINGTATVVTDYRFRGISQTDKNFAVQGSITVSHESGFYVSVWGSSVDNYVTASLNGHQEIDIIGGFKKSFGGTTVDIGALYYFYPKSKFPGDVSSSDFIEPYLAVSHTFGPVTGKVSGAYAPKQKALALDQISPAQDNFYLAGDLSASIPNTPIGLSAHLGHNFGPSWLVPVPKKGYTDWAVGATVTYKALTLGVQYIDTDASPLSSLTGKNVSKGGVVGTLGVSF